MMDIFNPSPKSFAGNYVLERSYIYTKIQQTRTLVTCQRFGDLFLIGLVWQFYLFVTEEIPTAVSWRAPDKEAWPRPTAIYSTLNRIFSLFIYRARKVLSITMPSKLFGDFTKK